MPSPDFVLSLRERIGHELIWMSGVTALVLDTPGRRVLSVRRADTGVWTPVTGIIDPGEQPARAAVREVAEEAGIRARPRHLIEVRTLPEMTYPNGDRAQYLDLTFVLEHEEGEPHPADGENTEARWLPWDETPPWNDRFLRVLRRALAGETVAEFQA